MSSDQRSQVGRPGPETELERRRRVERLREAILAGRYFVPAADVARSLVRRLGLDGLALQHQ
jgi:anti-sigma28 factor (negative regulator of flagellin synthesis)